MLGASTGGYIGKKVPLTQTTLGVYIMNMSMPKAPPRKIARRYMLSHRRSSFSFARRRMLVNRLRNVYKLPTQLIARITGYSLRTIHLDIKALVSTGKKAFHRSKLGMRRSKKVWGRFALKNIAGLIVSFKQLCRLAFLYLNGEIDNVETATGDEPP